MASGRRLWAPARGKGTAPHKPTLISSIVAALLAVGVVATFVLLRTGPTSPSSHRSSPPSLSHPSTSLPQAPAPTTAPTTSVPTSAGALTPPPAAAAAPVTTCTRQDLSIVTSTSASGGTVTLVTQLRAVRACNFQPVPTGPYSCASWLAVTDTSGQHQLWPAGGQDEQCSPPSASLLEPGTVQTLRAGWSPAGQGPFVAVGSWAWSAGPGLTPYVVSARSAPFGG